MTKETKDLRCVAQQAAQIGTQKPKSREGWGTKQDVKSNIEQLF